MLLKTTVAPPGDYIDSGESDTDSIPMTLNSMRNKYPVVLKQLESTENGGSGEAKSIPVHCIVEGPSTGPQERGENGSSSDSSLVELDTYAILPSMTLFSEIVRTALTKLGYTCTEALGAKGLIQIKHWKPLTFDTITESPDTTVEDILGDLTSVATLRIRLCSRSKQNSLEDMKEKLLSFLLHHSESVLLSAGCPIEKNMLSQISKGDYPVHIADETRHAFEEWYKTQNLVSRAIKRPAPGSSSEKTEDGQLSFAGKPSGGMPVNYPALRSELNSSYFARTRPRTSFDPDLEIPRLQRWFMESQHPTREQMLVYLNELNSLESRRGRKPLDLTNIIYWFKNARAAVRRSETARSGDEQESGSEFPPGHVPMDADDSYEDHLSPSSQENVPILPNRNAIYVVRDPYHQTGENESPESPVIHIMPQSPEDAHRSPRKVDSNENLDKSKEPNRELQNAETDDVGKENIDQENGQVSNGYRSSEDYPQDIDDDSNSPSDLRIKTETDEEDYNSTTSSACPSPLTSSTPRHVPVPSLASQLARPPPAHQQPLDMTVMPHPLNMHFMPSPHHMFSSMDSSQLIHSRQFKELNQSLNQQHEDHRKKRSRVFIDPLTEIPRLEKWFSDDTHPSSYMIEKYTEELNRAEYRQRFPKLEAKNVQLWFKNHRAKVKRSRLETSCIKNESSLCGTPRAQSDSPRQTEMTMVSPMQTEMVLNMSHAIQT